MARNKNLKVRQHFPKKIYFVICEDKKSMLYYLQGLNQDVKENIHLSVSHAQHTGIQNIQKEVKDKEREIKKSQAYGDYQVLACFDKDDNDISKIKSIIAENDKVPTRGTIYNSPCYEYWLLLHIQKTSKPFSSSQECEKQCLKQINKVYSKNFENIDELKRYEGIYKLVRDDIDTAIENADSLSFEDLNNTYTNTHIFIKEVRQ